MVAKPSTRIETPQITPSRAGIRPALLCRQAIYDHHRNIHGYELLYRRDAPDNHPRVDGNQATADVLLTLLSHIGIEQLSPSAPLFINCTRDFLMADPILPPDRCVLEILEDIELDDAMVSRIVALRGLGYRLALDDFVYSDQAAAVIPLVHYVKLDVLHLSARQLVEHVHVLRKQPILLIAEKIESEAQLDFCRQLRFDLFQGYYLRQPDLLRGKRLKTDRLSAFKLLSECQNPNASIASISAIIAIDVSLTYSLLRMANSALFGGVSEVKSIPQAVTRLGINRVIGLAAILSLASDADCPKGYLEHALQRGYMCELLATMEHVDAPASCFLVGLLSSLDAIMQAPLSDIVAQLPLTSTVRDALLNYAGEIGQVLRAVLAYEAGDWNTVLTSDMSENSLRSAYWRSIEASGTTLRLIS
jgi:EAL and modified HD-GYP domain-containing signal transduction protein